MLRRVFVPARAQPWNPSTVSRHARLPRFAASSKKRDQHSLSGAVESAHSENPPASAWNFGKATSLRSVPDGQLTEPTLATNASSILSSLTSALRPTPAHTRIELVAASPREGQTNEVFEALSTNSGVTVSTTAETGQQSRFHHLDSVFLRDQCTCPSCVNVSSGQKQFHTSQIPPNVKAVNPSQGVDGSIKVSWQNDISSYSADHVTTITQAQLQEILQRDVALKMQPMWDSKGWTFREMESRYSAGLNRASFDDFVNDNDTFSRILSELKTHGLAFFTGVPHSETSVEKLGERIGPLRHTWYGRTWDVKDKPKATNVAYTSTFLGMHMDLLYMKTPPGLQLLHCLESSCEGGESLFIDSFEAAYRLREVSPDAFDALATFPVSYHYNAANTGRYYFDTKPTIDIDHKTTNALGESTSRKVPIIANINWSPPFQAPFTADTGTFDAGSALHKYHAAARAFSSLVDDPARQFRVRLDPGECVIFNNRRVLHGREAFKSGRGGRWLKGAYCEQDDFESCVRYAMLSG